MKDPSDIVAADLHAGALSTGTELGPGRRHTTNMMPIRGFRTARPWCRSSTFGRNELGPRSFSPRWQEKSTPPPMNFAQTALASNVPRRRRLIQGKKPFGENCQRRSGESYWMTFLERFVGTVWSMARAFDIGGPATALRLYLILICCAARGETVTYEELAQRAHQQDKGLLAPPLDLVAGWCQANGLPALTLLIVETATGKPAPGVDATREGNVAAEQDKVREYDSFAIFPPSVAELTPAQKIP
jgi:hypothetical protein